MLLERFQKFCGRQCARPDRNTRQRFGLRQPSAAFVRAVISKSGSGLPQSKTSRNSPSALPKQATVLMNTDKITKYTNHTKTIFDGDHAHWQEY